MLYSIATVVLIDYLTSFFFLPCWHAVSIPNSPPSASTCRNNHRLLSCVFLTVGCCCNEHTPDRTKTEFMRTHTYIDRDGGIIEERKRLPTCRQP